MVPNSVLTSAKILRNTIVTRLVLRLGKGMFPPFYTWEAKCPVEVKIKTSGVHFKVAVAYVLLFSLFVSDGEGKEEFSMLSVTVYLSENKYC